MRLLTTGLAAAVFLLALPRPALAQLTTCAVNGEYVVSASLYNAFGPHQLGGTLVFTPPEVCAAGASGSVAIDVVYTPAAGDRVRTFRTVVPYRLDGGVVLIGDGLAIAVCPALRRASSPRCQ